MEVGGVLGLMRRERDLRERVVWSGTSRSSLSRMNKDRSGKLYRRPDFVIGTST